MRRALDFYETETKVTKALLDNVGNFLKGTDYINSRKPTTVLEPCCGSGKISEVLTKEGQFTVYQSDINLALSAGNKFLELPEYDCSKPEYWQNVPKVDWVITNPPFNLAEKIIPLAYEYSRVGIAMLLRLSYLEPTKGRAQWLKEHNLSKLIVLNPRPTFTGDGKCDSVTTAWFVWEKSQDTVKDFFYCNNWKD